MKWWNRATNDAVLTSKLIAYSEHSQCQELIDFVTFLKPREIVPTGTNPRIPSGSPSRIDGAIVVLSQDQAK